MSLSEVKNVVFLGGLQEILLGDGGWGLMQIDCRNLLYHMVGGVDYNPLLLKGCTFDCLKIVIIKCFQIRDVQKRFS